MTGSRGGRRLAVSGLGFAVAVLALIAAPLTQAGTVSKYQPNRAARTFDNGVGGWSQSVQYGPGLCDPKINCHTVSNSWHGKGGAGGGGYISTKLDGRVGAAGSSSGTWRSAGFRYRGVNGKRPTRLDLTVTRRFNVAGLLNIAGNSAHYTVEVVNARSGVAVAPIDNRRISDSPDWTRMKAHLGSGTLKVGGRYYIKITTRFKTGAEAFPSATADYDNVVVRASRKSRPHHGGSGRPPGHGHGGGHGHGHGGGHGHGHGGGHGHHGGGGHTVVLHHNKLVIKPRCPKKYGHGRCKIKTVALTHKGGRHVTRAGHGRARSGHHKRIKMRVRHRFEGWVKKHHRVVVRERLRVHHHTHHIQRRYRIVKK